MPLLHSATVTRNDLAQAVKHIMTVMRDHRKPLSLSIRAEGDDLVLSSPEVEARVSFSGKWSAAITVPAEIFTRLVMKRPSKVPILLTYAGGFMSIGPTRLSVEEIGSAGPTKSRQAFEPDTLAKCLLPGVPVELILDAYMSAAGNEIESGKFANPESSAALAANTFGFFLNRPQDLPTLPETRDLGWPATAVALEATIRFPWKGGHHPCLDVLVVNRNALIGIESKRYEPFRPKRVGKFSKAYWRPVWGDAMGRYEAVRDALNAGRLGFAHLDGVQLVKHAFGLRTAVNRDVALRGKRPVLYYVHAEPPYWPDGRINHGRSIERHRQEIEQFAKLVAGDEVRFLSCTYRRLLTSWTDGLIPDISDHAMGIAKMFSP